MGKRRKCALFADLSVTAYNTLSQFVKRVGLVIVLCVWSSSSLQRSFVCLFLWLFLPGILVIISGMLHNEALIKRQCIHMRLSKRVSSSSWG